LVHLESNHGTGLRKSKAPPFKKTKDGPPKVQNLSIPGTPVPVYMDFG